MVSVNEIQKILSRLQLVKENIERYALEDIEPRLVIVTKNQSIEKISKLEKKLDSPIFGENRVDEALSKIENVHNFKGEWHFIGHLQKNKVKKIIGHVSLIQSLDRLELAVELEKRAALDDIIVNCLLEIDICQDGTKFGLPPEENLILKFLKSIQSFSHLKVLGLMTIAPFIEPEGTRKYFKKMRSIYDNIQRAELPSNIEMKILSMGMTNDYIIALQEGSNMVRIGSAIFNASRPIKSI
ncbi:MAG: YggS family pyridoxal phosphate-dependent enzyme [Candidatus Hodarchaeales archaeon]